MAASIVQLDYRLRGLRTQLLRSWKRGSCSAVDCTCTWLAASISSPTVSIVAPWSWWRICGNNRSQIVDTVSTGEARGSTRLGRSCLPRINVSTLSVVFCAVLTSMRRFVAKKSYNDKSLEINSFH